IVLLPTRPSAFGSPILAIPITKVDKTSGAIINLMSRKNKSPSGATTFIDSPRITPKIIAMINATKIWVNKFPFNHFISSHLPKNCFSFHYKAFSRKKKGIKKSSLLLQAATAPFIDPYFLEHSTRHLYRRYHFHCQ